MNGEPPGKGPLQIRGGDILLLTGWAIAEREGRAPGKLFVVFQRPNDEARSYAAVAERVARPDIAQGASASTFTVAIDSGPLPRGVVQVLLAFRDGECQEICDSGRRIRVE